MSDPLSHIEQAFGGQPRPEHFTNYRHCCECAEHDEVLRSLDPTTIGIQHLSPAWDPICFATLEGYLYYLPGLARLALGTGDEYYLDQFLFHLRPERLCAFTAPQRRAVRRLLDHVLDSLLDEVQPTDLDALDQRISELAALDALARVPGLVRRLFYAVKQSLHDPYATRNDVPTPKPELGHYAEVTHALLAEVEGHYRIVRYQVESNDYLIELAPRDASTPRYRATYEEMFVADSEGWESVGGYLYLDGLPLAGTPLHHDET